MAPHNSGDNQMTSEIGKQVFTTNGVYVGTVRDITLDVDGDKATRLAVNDLNPSLFKALPRERGVLIPYRWVRQTNDIVLVADVVERIAQDDQSNVKDVESVESVNTPGNDADAEQDTPAASEKANAGSRQSPREHTRKQPSQDDSPPHRQ